MLRGIGRLVGRSEEILEPRGRLKAARWPSVVYAVGDVHGCFEEMLALEAQIIADGRQIEGEKWIVMLGDYVDRGPSSAAVLNHLVTFRPPPGFRLIALAGNHEEMLLQLLRDPKGEPTWLENGGLETARSYGVQSLEFSAPKPRRIASALNALIPRAHIEWLQALPILLMLPGALFVHAGVRPGIPLAEQEDQDLLWSRIHPADAPVAGTLVVHGHSADLRPIEAPGRVCVDTGAYATGVLSAVRLSPGAAPLFLSSRVSSRRADCS
jgi:serine/threonine protein phosphatase 1